MLDDREQRTLQELEAQLVAQDPRLARALRGLAADSPQRRHDHVGVRIGVTLAALSGSFLLTTGDVAAASLFLGLVVVLWALWHYSGDRQVTPGSPPEDGGGHR